MVDLAIVLPVFGAESRTGMCDMAQRPDSLVGEAEVEALLLLLRQPDTAQRVLRVVRRNGDAVECIDGHAVGRARALSDPGSAAGIQHRVKRRDQSARRNFVTDLFLGQEMFVWFAVGNHEHARAGELPLGVDTQPDRKSTRLNSS